MMAQIMIAAKTYSQQSPKVGCKEILMVVNAAIDDNRYAITATSEDEGVLF
jgi:hypothetical protein